MPCGRHFHIHSPHSDWNAVSGMLSFEIGHIQYPSRTSNTEIKTASRRCSNIVEASGNILFIGLIVSLRRRISTTKRHPLGLPSASSGFLITSTGAYDSQSVAGSMKPFRYKSSWNFISCSRRWIGHDIRGPFAATPTSSRCCSLSRSCHGAGTNLWGGSNAFAASGQTFLIRLAIE